MASFNYNYVQESFRFFLFLMLIRAIVVYSPLGLQNLNLKTKPNDFLVFFSQTKPSRKWPIDSWLFESEKKPDLASQSEISNLNNIIFKTIHTESSTHVLKMSCIFQDTQRKVCITLIEDSS